MWIRWLLCVLITLALFVLAAFSNTLENLESGIFLKLFPFFIWGLLIKRYLGLRVFSIGLIVLLALVGNIYRQHDFVFFDFASFRFSFCLIGYVAGYFWDGKFNWVAGIGFLGITSLFFYYTQVFYVNSVLDSMEVEGHELEGKSISQYPAASLYKDDIPVSPIKKGQVYLVEFYFNSCAPCRAKKTALRQLERKLGCQVKILYIQNGKLDKKPNRNSVVKGDSNLIYDKQGLFTESLQIAEFPTELIIDKQGVVRHVLCGYEAGSSFGLNKRYINETLRKLRSIDPTIISAGN